MKVSSSNGPSSTSAGYSLKRRLTLPVIIVFLALGTLTYFVLRHETRTYLEQQFDAGLEARLVFLAGLTKFDAADPEEGVMEPEVEFDFEPHFVPDFSPGQSQAFFQLWQNDVEFARSGSLEDQQLIAQPGDEDALLLGDYRLPDGRAARAATLRFRPDFDEDWGDSSADRERAYRELYPGRQRPLMTLTVVLVRDPLDDTLAYLSGLQGIGLLLLMAAVSLLTWLGVSHGLKPLRGLVGQLDRIGSDSLDGRVAPDGLPREVAPLALTINQLLDRLQRSFERERLFSRNIAHELRTPIAEMLSIGEVGARWPDDAAASARFFEEISGIARRMDLLVSNLLMMARQESGQLVCSLEPIDLSGALRRARQQFDREMTDEQVELNLAVPEQLMIKADRVCLDIVLSNLTSNAIHHGGPVGERRAEVITRGNRAELTFENSANGLEDADLGHLFSRFWRKDTARSGSRHLGLGLALVQTLAQASGWQVSAELRPGGRFRIVVGNIELA